MSGKLYIVSGKKTAAEADWLEARIDEGETAAAVEGSERWTVREYLAGAERCTQADALVFVGAADAWAHETEGGAPTFDRFGIRCLVRGRRALLTASEGPIEGKKEKRAFLDYVKANCPEIGADELAWFDAERKIALFDSLRAAINPFSMVLEQQQNMPAGSADLTELERLQYRVAGLEFVRSVLPGWM